MADRILLKGGHVITVDPDLGDIPGGDVLIEGDTIAQVGTMLSADAEVIDVTGDIVIPGFVELASAHVGDGDPQLRSQRHAGRLLRRGPRQLRAAVPPEDVYASNLAGALECINAGITTLLDWSHINNKSASTCCTRASSRTTHSGTARPRRSRGTGPEPEPPRDAWCGCRTYVEVAVMMLENPSIAGTEFWVDSGWSLPL